MPTPPVIGQKNGIFEDRAFFRPSEGQAIACSILVVGGSTAAYSATVGALRSGVDVCLVQPHAIVGGQFTVQALPASDDGDLLQQKATIERLDGERFAISITQRRFRDRQRELQKVNGKVLVNPGGGWVSPLATTPVVAATALNEAIAPYIAEGKLRLIPFAEPIGVIRHESLGHRRRVTGVVFQDRQNRRTFTVNGKVVIEATDLGDLLELGEIESRYGQESRSQTGEQALPDRVLPACQQSFTFGAVVQRTPPGQGVPIGAPPGYDVQPWLKTHEFEGSYWAKSRGQWEPQPRDFFHDFGIFRYRRLLRSADDKTVRPGDVSVLNWGQHQHGETGPLCCGNDYRVGELVGVSREERQLHWQQARDRARAYVHYLQTKGGMKDLKPRGDLTWTKDGIALEPYIREARRGVALTTIRHEDVAKPFFPGQARARTFEDTVGIGQYHYLDLHGNDEPGHASLPGENVIAEPFTLPLGSLIPINTDGLILSSKSIGTTHITNAVYRMHPAEWAIGEAGGHLAALAVKENVDVRAIATNTPLVRKLQGILTRQGIPIFWFDDIAHDDPDFEAIQVLAAAGIIRSESNSDLHFRPQTSVNRAVVSTALMKVMGFELITPPNPTFSDVLPNYRWAYSSIETMYAKGITVGIDSQRFGPERAITREQLSIFVRKTLPAAYEVAFARTPQDRQVLQRRELSRVLYRVLRVRLGI